MVNEEVEEAGTSLGAFYPEHAAVAVVDDAQTAQEFMRALKDSGYPVEAGQVWQPRQIIEGLRELKEGRNPVQKLGAFLSDEDLWQKQYHEFAQQGNAMMVIPAETADDARQIASKLDHNRIRLLRHYGDSVVTDVLPDPGEATPAH